MLVDIYVTGDGGAEGAGTGRINVALPASAGASHNGFKWPAGMYSNGATQAPLYGEVNSTTIVLYKSDGTDMTGADQNSTSRDLRLKFFYEV